MSATRIAPLALLAACLGLAFSLPVTAEEALKERTYTFGTHPARTNITFVSEADLETIHGVTHQVVGQVTVNKDGTGATGRLSIGVEHMRTGIDLRDEHLRSDQWLDAARYPEITLELISATEDKDKRTWNWRGNLTIKSQTREVSGSARIRAIPTDVGAALGAGEWVRVRTELSVRLSDYGIKIPEQIGPKVSEVWSIGVDLYGTTVDPRREQGAR